VRRNTMYRFSFIILTVLISFLTFAQAQPASAKARTVQDKYEKTEDFATAILPCLEESIRFTGTTRANTITVWDSRGGFHYHFTLRQKARGETESGREFLGIWRTKGSFNSPAGPPVDEIFNSYVQQAQFISPGSGIELVIHTTAHFTMNGKGEVVVSFDKTRVECK
jgi:hypothetical protein